MKPVTSFVSSFDATVWAEAWMSAFLKAADNLRDCYADFYAVHATIGLGEKPPSIRDYDEARRRLSEKGAATA